MRNAAFTAFGGLSLFLIAGCSSDPAASAVATDAGVSDSSTSPPGIDIDAECPVIVSDSACDKTQRPIVFVHGTYAAGDDIANIALLFTSNGFCPERFVAIDYNSLLWVTNGMATANNATPAIDAAIDAILKSTGATQVDLMGHSQGAMQGYAYLQDPAHAAKVAHFVQLAGGAQPAPPGPADAGVPTLSVSSKADVVLGPNGVTGAEKTVVLEKEDHQGVAASANSFSAIWQYLHQGPGGAPDGQIPKYLTVQCGDPDITLSGVGETFGDNQPPSAGKLEVYEVGSDPADAGAPVQTFTNNTAGGAVGPWQAKRLQPYEFRGLNADGSIIGHQYFTPFKRSNYWLRFLVPSSSPLAKIATNPVTSLKDDNEVTLLVRTNQGSFRQDLGDSLTVDDYQALNATNATSATVTAGLWIYDANKNGKSEGGSVSAFNILPYFIRGTDVFMASTPPAWVTLNLNGQVLKVPNWPSVSQGLVYVTFQ